MELISAGTGWGEMETGCGRARMEMNSAGLDGDGCSFHTHAGLYFVYFSCQHDATRYRSLGGLQLLIESRYAAPVSQLSVDDNDNDNERELIQRVVINKSRTR